VGEKTIWYEMAELIFEKKTDDGLSWGITFYSNAPTLRHQSG
jgi:hypothetical protein